MSKACFKRFLRYLFSFKKGNNLSNIVNSISGHWQHVMPSVLTIFLSSIVLIIFEEFHLHLWRYQANKYTKVFLDIFQCWLKLDLYNVWKVSHICIVKPIYYRETWKMSTYANLLQKFCQIYNSMSFWSGHLNRRGTACNIPSYQGVILS